jgi:hypothetical protein
MLPRAVADELGLVFAIDIAHLTVELIGVSLQIVLLTGAVVVKLLLVVRLELTCLTNKAFEFSFPNHTPGIDSMSVRVVQGVELTAAAALAILVEPVEARSVLVEVARYGEDVIHLKRLAAERAVEITPLVA